VNIWVKRVTLILIDLDVYAVQEFPIKSKRGPEFGDPTSAITAEHIEDKLEGRTVEQVFLQVPAQKSGVLEFHGYISPYSDFLL
jgi:lipoxygenase